MPKEEVVVVDRMDGGGHNGADDCLINNNAKSNSNSEGESVEDDDNDNPPVDETSDDVQLAVHMPEAHAELTVQEYAWGHTKFIIHCASRHDPTTPMVHEEQGASTKSTYPS
jgi:hypothetical protein